MRALGVACLFSCLFSGLFSGLAAAAEPASLTLEDAVRIACAHHPTLQASRAQLEGARARLEQGRAGFLPSATGSFSYQPQTANFAPTPSFQRALSGGTTGAPSQAVSYELFDFWSVGFGLTWTAFDWGRTYYGWRASRTGVDAQRLTVQSSTAQVVLEVKLAYYGVLAAEASVAVSNEAIASQQRHVDQARAFHSAGTRTKIDVVSAESDLANAELTLARAHGDLDTARATLSAALGEDEWRAYTLTSPVEPADESPPSDEALFDEALKARPEPRELALRARGFGETARSLRGAYFPALTLQLGPSFQGTQLGALTPNVTIAVGIGYPLVGVNPFLVHGQVREARANELATLEQARAVRNTVRLETASARALLSSARQAVAAARKLVTAARERRDLADGRYQAGVGSILELSDAELAFENARFQEVRAQFDVAQARARLDRARGRT